MNLCRLPRIRLGGESIGAFSVRRFGGPTSAPRLQTRRASNPAESKGEGFTEAAPHGEGVEEKQLSMEKEISKLAKQTATTFAPRPSTATKNPAYKGTVLYEIFEWQAWISMGVGALLSFNVLFPTEDPSIPRLLGMWSIWMFTVPSLRAKECMPKEKDALNLLFVVIPLLNVALPFLWKSFPFIFSVDVLAVFSIYYWKGVWKEVYGFPLEAPGAPEPPAL